MKIHRHKSSVGKQEIKQDGMPCEPVRFTKGMARNSITLDTIGQVVSIMFQHVWFRGMLIELDNRKENDNSDA